LAYGEHITISCLYIQVCSLFPLHTYFILTTSCSYTHVHSLLLLCAARAKAQKQACMRMQARMRPHTSRRTHSCTHTHTLIHSLTHTHTHTTRTHNHILIRSFARTQITSRCGNVAAILELDEHLNKNFKVSKCGLKNSSVSERSRSGTFFCLIRRACDKPLFIKHFFGLVSSEERVTSPL
jgi:hypothetical protein